MDIKLVFKNLLSGNTLAYFGGEPVTNQKFDDTVTWQRLLRKRYRPEVEMKLLFKLR
jgi:hypothetical protein